MTCFSHNFPCCKKWQLYRSSCPIRLDSPLSLDPISNLSASPDGSIFETYPNLAAHFQATVLSPGVLQVPIYPGPQQAALSTASWRGLVKRKSECVTFLLPFLRGFPFHFRVKAKVIMVAYKQGPTQTGPSLHQLVSTLDSSVLLASRLQSSH